ncbi:MAG: glycosyltransferase family 61 protein [Cyanobacteria bacterium P01_D01_bin.44]
MLSQTVLEEPYPVKSLKISSQPLSIPESRIFTFPNRLGNPWQPDVMEMVSQREQIDPHDVEMSPKTGSTGDIRFHVKRAKSLEVLVNRPFSLINITKKIYKDSRKKLSSAIEAPSTHYLFDTRDEIFWHDGNIAHILCNVMPILLELRRQEKDVTVILRQRASDISKQIYALMGFPTISTDKAVKGNILAGEAHNQDLQLWRVGCFGRYFEQFESLLIPQSDFPEKVFISRRNSRIITNESEIDLRLSKFGFQKVYFEDLSLLEQWSLARNAKIVVGIHGAALANLAFNRNAVKLIELMHPGYATRFYRRCIASIDGHWCGVTAQMPKEFIKDLEFFPKPRLFAGYDLKIDPKSLGLALEFLESLGT